MGFLDNAGVDRVWKKFKEQLSNYLPLTGGTMKGLLNVPYGTAVHYTYGTRGSGGYVRLATIVIKGDYVDAPIELTITRRGDTQTTEIVILFNGVSSNDPTVRIFNVVGATTNVWIYKSAVSTWELYVWKNGLYDEVDVIGYHNPYNNNLTVTWQKDQISTLPDGAVQATVGEFLGVASKSTGIADYNDKNTTVKIGWSGDSLDSSKLAFLAGYTYDCKIKDVSKDAVRDYLGISNYETHTHGEATLTWGGKNLNGHVGPVGASLSAEHSANRLAFINGDALTIEYSKDGGTTWNDYGLTANQKSWLCTDALDIPIGRVDRSEKYTTNSKTRITIFAQPYFYTDPKKLLVNVSVSGRTELLIEYKKGIENAEWETYSTTEVSGWSGWNDIDLQLGSLGGGSGQPENNWYLRLTFSMKSVIESYAKTAYVLGLRLFGLNNWGSASKNAGKGNLSSTGHVYSYDANANVTFPNGVNAKTFNGHTVDADVPSDAKFTDTTYTEFQGTEGTHDGVAGLVPAPKKSEFGNSYGLGSDGTWRDFGQTFVSQSFAEGTYVTNKALENAIKELKKYVDQQSPGGVTLDSVYPIGSVYISANGANPNAIIGGTWEEFATGRTLIGYDPSDDDLTETGMTGGEKTHVLTVEEMPSHNHSASTGGAGKHKHTVGYRKRQDAYGKGTLDAMHWITGTASTIETSEVANHSHTVTVESTGSGMAHNNMMPYITVRMWKRTA
jgi:hypothetical protein